MGRDKEWVRQEEQKLEKRKSNRVSVRRQEERRKRLSLEIQQRPQRLKTRMSGRQHPHQNLFPSTLLANCAVLKAFIISIFLG